MSNNNNSGDVLDHFYTKHSGAVNIYKQSKFTLAKYTLMNEQG